jgi:glucosamine-6-phosphate deaminase
MNTDDNMTSVIIAPIEQIVSEIAREISDLILVKRSLNKSFVLGLPATSTLIPLYQELIRLHHQGELSFKNVMVFNLYEYYPIRSSSLLSSNHFLWEHFLKYIDIPLDQFHILYGDLAEEEVDDYCQYYDALIDHYGGLDMQILNTDERGYIGFNKSGSGLESKTRIVTHEIQVDSKMFEYIPNLAITMGVSTVMKANKIILLAMGDSNLTLIKKLLKGEIDKSIPLTFLLKHRELKIFSDQLDKEILNSSIRIVLEFRLNEVL